MVQCLDVAKALIMDASGSGRARAEQTAEIAVSGCAACVHLDVTTEADARLVRHQATQVASFRFCRECRSLSLLRCSLCCSSGQASPQLEFVIMMLCSVVHRVCRAVCCTALVEPLWDMELTVAELCIRSLLLHIKRHLVLSISQISLSPGCRSLVRQPKPSVEKQLDLNYMHKQAT